MTSKPPSAPAKKPPPGHVPLVDPSLKDEEWRQTVKKCLDDPARCLAANEIKPENCPVLADTIDKKLRDDFMNNLRQINKDIPPTRIQSLLQVLAASHLLQEVDFNRVESLYLPNTSQRAMVVRLSHIKRFKEKPAFLHQVDYSYAMIHGTNLIGAKYCLAEGLVRPADWSYDEQLSKCEQPTDGAQEHLALKAGGNDWVQLQCALKGVVTTSEKYTVARSEHCTIRSVIVVWPDLSFIEGRKGRSATYKPATSKEKSKEATDDDDRPPKPEELRRWNRPGHHYDDEEEP
eukprot:s1881_g9.t1